MSAKLTVQLLAGTFLLMLVMNQALAYDGKPSYSWLEINCNY